MFFLEKEVPNSSWHLMCGASVGRLLRHGSAKGCKLQEPSEFACGVRCFGGAAAQADTRGLEDVSLALRSTTPSPHRQLTLSLSTYPSSCALNLQLTPPHACFSPTSPTPAFPHPICPCTLPSITHTPALLADPHLHPSRSVLCGPLYSQLSGQSARTLPVRMSPIPSTMGIHPGHHIHPTPPNPTPPHPIPPYPPSPIYSRPCDSMMLAVLY